MKNAEDHHARRSPAVQIFRLGDEPPDDIGATTTAEERLDLLRELTERAWTLGGKPFPAYSRDRIPVRIVTME